MKTRGFVFGMLLGLAARPVGAHVLPVHSVRAQLRGAGEALHLHLDTNAIYWQEEVLGAEPPLEDWSQDLLDKAKAYIDSHLKLALDGKPLEGRLVEARYAHEPWQDWKSGRIHFRLSFPLPSQEGKLSGEMRFFFEEKAHEAGAAGRELLRVAKEKDFPREFWTELEIRGKGSRVLKLTPESPGFSFPVEAALQSFPQAVVESGLLGLRWSLHSGALILFAAFLALYRGGMRSWMLAGAALLVPLLCLFVPPLAERSAAVTAWLLAALAAAAARKRAPFGIWLGGMTFFLPVWAMVLRAAMDATPYRFTTGAGDFAFGAGAWLAGVLAAGAAAGLIGLYRRQLHVHTESRAEEIFHSRMDAAAVLGLIASALLLLRVLAPGGVHG